MRKSVIGGAMALALALAPATVLAAEMSDDTMMADSMVPHPSHIHVGLCPTPGDVIAPLNDVAVAGTDSQGVADHIHVDVGITTVDLALSDILASDHAIVVHHSADDMGTYIACGNIGGNPVGDLRIVVVVAQPAPDRPGPLAAPVLQRQVEPLAQAVDARIPALAIKLLVNQRDLAVVVVQRV